MYVVFSKLHLYELLKQAKPSVGFIHSLPIAYDKLAILASFGSSRSVSTFHLRALVNLHSSPE